MDCFINCHSLILNDLFFIRLSCNLSKIYCYDSVYWFTHLKNAFLRKCALVIIFVLFFFAKNQNIDRISLNQIKQIFFNQFIFAVGNQSFSTYVSTRIVAHLCFAFCRGLSFSVMEDIIILIRDSIQMCCCIFPTHLSLVCS